MADSIRDALTAAYDKAETEDTTPAADIPVSNADPVDTTPDSPQPETASTQDVSVAEGTAPTEAPKAPAAPETPAPASWNAEERAGWATVPEAARKAILRRESEMNASLKFTAQARRRAEAIDKIAEPYQPILNSYGVTVEQVLPNLLATRAALEVGTPEQKAQLVANICADFGLDINILDDALAARYHGGRPTPRYNGPPPQMDLAGNPQLAPLFAMAEQLKVAQTERAAAAIAEVKTDPHYDAVRFTMADLIEQAQSRGNKLDLQTALGLAKQLHGLGAPAAPQAPMSVSDAARTLAAARNAAASVGGAPKPSPARKPGTGSLRDELEANFAATRR